ncbi:hypothetical protein BH09MYX1_BH09MYX1_58080 [soil metagenome]
MRDGATGRAIVHGQLASAAVAIACDAHMTSDWLVCAIGNAQQRSSPGSVQSLEPAHRRTVSVPAQNDWNAVGHADDERHCASNDESTHPG